MKRSSHGHQFHLTNNSNYFQDKKFPLPEMYTDQKEIFKACPMCGKKWQSRDAFLDDPDLIFNGYQANFGKIDEGLFYFTHTTAECGSTLAIRTKFFFSLYSGNRYSEIKMNTKECRGYCLNRHELQRCQAHCTYAYIREVSQIIKDRMETEGP